MKQIMLIFVCVFSVLVLSPVYWTFAQNDQCSLREVLDSFGVAQATGSVSDWAQRFADCENQVRLGAGSIVDAYQLIADISTEGLGQPCSREAILASFHAAALSNEINAWVRIYSNGCPNPVPNAVNSLAGAYRMLTSTTVVLEPLNENQGWHVPDGATGTIIFNRNNLILTTEPQATLFIVPIPNIVVDPSRFYVELDTEFAHTDSDQWIGIAIGNFDSQEFHVFLYGDIWDYWGIKYQGVGTNDDLNIEEATELQIDYEVPIKIGLEANNGHFVLSVNRRALRAVSITTSGQQLGLAIMNGGCCGSAGTMAVSRVIIGVEPEDVLETP